MKITKEHKYAFVGLIIGLFVGIVLTATMMNDLGSNSYRAGYDYGYDYGYDVGAKNGSCIVYGTYDNILQCANVTVMSEPNNWNWTCYNENIEAWNDMRITILNECKWWEY